MINKDFFEGPVGDYCIARNTIKCLFNMGVGQIGKIFVCVSPFQSKGDT